MNYTAAQLFPDWYSKGINKEVSSEELNQRREAINKILIIDKGDKWLDLLKVYLEFSKIESAEYNNIVDLVKYGDENFLIKNENLVKIISGCAIAQKIEANDSSISDFLALGLITTEFLPTVQNLITDLPGIAKRFWISECESKREIELDYKIGNPVKSNTKIEIPELTAEEATWKAFAEGITKVLKGLQKDLQNANEEINAQQSILKTAKQNVIALSEETDMLWWLFSSFSSTLNTPFSKLSKEFLSVLVSFELFDLTKKNPGIGGIERIINKALMHSVPSENQLQNFETFINSVTEHEAKLIPLLPKEYPELTLLTPLVYGIRCRTQHAGSEWEAVFSKKCSINLKTEISFENFSSQLYKELMLTSVYSTL